MLDIVTYGSEILGRKAESVKDIDDAMSGNICRCGAYQRIRAAIKDAAGMEG